MKVKDKITLAIVSICFVLFIYALCTGKFMPF